MDRFDEKAREICEHISRDQAAFITGTTEALTAAILRAAAEMGKPEPVKAKPVAGEWERSRLYYSAEGERFRYVPGVRDERMRVEACWAGRWRWDVWTCGGRCSIAEGFALTHEAAMAAADAWARTHANELDWCLPEPVEQPAPRSPDLMARMAEALRVLAGQAVFAYSDVRHFDGALSDFFVEQSPEHEDGCPEDDTCDCEELRELNAAGPRMHRALTRLFDATRGAVALLAEYDAQKERP